MSGRETATATDVGFPRQSFADTAPLDDRQHLPEDPVTADEPDPARKDLSSEIHAAQHGDEEAFRVIYRTLQPALLRYLRVLVGDEAEDVASDTWLQIVRDLPSFRGDSSGFRGWAATIARHRALDHLRRRRRRPGVDVPIDQVAEPASPDDTAGRALEMVSTDAALRLIASLPRDQAEAVLLRVVMGLDAKTTGQVLGKRAGAVRTAAYRGLRRLAEQLGPGGNSTVGCDGRSGTMRRER